MMHTARQIIGAIRMEPRLTLAFGLFIMLFADLWIATP